VAPLTTLDQICADELHKTETMHHLDDQTRMTWWVREYRLWPWPRVLLRQWKGTRWQNSMTGESLWLAVPRYWQLWWRVFRVRRKGDYGLPRAMVRP